MKINRDNYEAYFLDYHEGQLSPEMRGEVLLFVEMNPDLMSVFNEFEAVTLATEQDIVFENKTSLKKNQVFATSSINDSNYEKFLAGETEGLLNTVQLASLEEFISINPQFEKDRRLYALAHLPAENDIVFEGKELLKQKAIAVGAITAETYETYMARETEGDLNAGEALQIAEFMLYNQHLQKERELYSHTILKTETDIVFAGKEQLKHSIVPVRRLVYYALSAAASLALIVSFYFLLNRNDIPPGLANQENGKPVNEQPIQNPSSSLPDPQIAVNTSPETTQIAAKENNDIHPSTPDVSIADTKIPDSQIAMAGRLTIEPMQVKDAIRIKTRDFVDPQFTFIRMSRMYSNQHLEFYYNLKLAEDIQYAGLNSKDKNPVKTLLNAANERTGNLFASKRNPPASKENTGFSMWTLAELGVQTINTVTSSEMELNLKKDDEGKVVGYDLESGLFNIEKDFKK